MTDQKPPAAGGRRAASDEDTLLARLTQMPKPEVRDVALSVTTQWKYLLLTGVGFVAVSGLFYILSIYGQNEETWFIWSLVMLAIAPTPALVGAITALWVLSQSRKLKRMTRGEYYVHWTIPDAQWQQFCDDQQTKFWWLPAICCACFVGAALLFAALIYADGNVHFGSVLGHFSVISLIGAAIGVAVGFYLWFMGGITRRLMQNRTPQVVIGAAGVYYTSHFWPTSTLGQRLTSVGPSPEKPESLQFNFRVNTNHGVQQTSVLVPFPETEREEAQLVCRLLP